LAKQIGFVDHAQDVFKLEEQLSTFRHVVSGYLRSEGKCRIIIFVNFMVTPCINNAEPFLLPTDAHNVKKRRVIKTF